MMLITFTAPTHPLSENESRRLHWATRSRRLKPWATATMAAWRKADQEDKATLNGQKIRVQVSIPFSRNARRDPHNYIGTNIKTIIDALITEGMTPDDTSEYIEVIEPQLVIRKDNEVHILLTPTGPIEERNVQAHKRRR